MDVVDVQEVELRPEALEAAAAALPPPTLRGLDAIHLATALELVVDLEAFLACDKGLAIAAESVGLTVESPGMSL